MTIWELCVRRPIFTTVLVSAPIILGIASYQRLGVELFPNVDIPLVTITTTLRGASVEEVESSLTKPIEEIVNTISGIDELRSTTKEGFSQVVVAFKLHKDGDIAAQEVDQKVSSIIGQLPVGIDPPIIDKFAVDASPILTIAVSGDRDMREVTEIARKRLKENLETVPGVGSVVLVGGRQRAINVIVHIDQLRKYPGLTVEDVRQALIRENREDPGGRVDRGTIEFVLRTMGRAQTPEDFAELIVANRNGYPVRIGDVARVEDSFEEPRGLSRLWMKSQQPEDAVGENSVSLIVQKQSGENTVIVADTVKARLAELATNLPPDIKTIVIRDQSRFIKNSMEEVKVHLLLAAVLVSCSVMLFLRDWRTTVIATLSIPTSLIGAFVFMDLMGFSINNFTMIGLILAVGIVVDDAVVVHENIFRHMEEKNLSARAASLSATSEIALAVVATTLSLVVIFAPIAFMGGMVGRFFSSFGYVVGFCVLMSMFVSFTMTPMLCSRFLKPLGHSGRGWFWMLIENSYIGLLSWSLKHRLLVMAMSLALLVTTPTLFTIVGKDFVPKDDQSEFLVTATLPEGYTLDRADSLMNEIDLRLRQLPGVTDTLITIGETSGRAAKGQGDVTKAQIYCQLVDLTERDFTQFAVMKDARKIMGDYPDVRSTVQIVNVLSSSAIREVDIDLNLSGPDLDELQTIADKIADWMREKPGYVDVDISLATRKPELRVRPNRERLSDLGVSLQSISDTCNILVGGVPVTKFKEGDEQYDVWLRADRQDRSDATAIAMIEVPSSKTASGAVELANVVDFETALGPNVIDRHSRQRQVVVSANLDDKDLGSAVTELTALLKEMNLPPEYRYMFLGDAKTQSESDANFAMGFILAFVFMYMILAAQFESFVHPISILMALPLTLPCAVISLIFLQTSLDVFAMLGLFMLFGIVKKNGILQVDYTNQLRAQGMRRDQAILEANRTRLRPILMTTVMLVAAMVPMALGEGPGAGTRASMAKVILGGQSLSLILTLLVTPVAYSLFDSIGQTPSRLARRFGRSKTTQPQPLEPVTH
ncbi:efflux RND transporter permease subunit [Lacunimicrobium album]